MLSKRAFALFSTASVNLKTIHTTSIRNQRCLRCIATQKCILPTNTTHQFDSHRSFAANPSQSVHIPGHFVRFYCDRKEINFKVVKSKELIKDAIKTKQSNLRERKEVFVKDLRETKCKVQDRMHEKVKQMEEIVERENVVTIPNLLCVARGLLAPVVGYAIVQEHFMLSIGLLAFAGLTDLVSGRCCFVEVN